MSNFVKILSGRYETDGVSVRSLTRGGTMSKHRQGGTAGYRLKASTDGAQVFYSAYMIHDLYRNALAVAKTQVPPAPAIPAPLLNDRAGNFIIGSRQNGMCSISPKPAVHLRLSLAKAEAERLAKSVPRKTFIVLEVIGEVQASGVSWK